MKKMIITMVMCFSFSSIILSPITTTYATETSIDSYSITRESNKHGLDLSKSLIIYRLVNYASLVHSI